MANNRLYVLNQKTGEAYMLCKSLGSGWYVNEGDRSSSEWVAALSDWLSAQDDFECNIGGKEPTRLILVDEFRLPKGANIAG